MTDARILDVTQRIAERSRESRADYLERMAAARRTEPARGKLSCANWAHAFAAATPDEKLRAMQGTAPNIGIVTAYNDMLSAHQPLETYPALIKQAVREVGATAQVAGGVPAMCDGVTQGRPGMELSLFSRDVIAMATAVALTHDAFDGAICLGTCDKIVPGLLIGALAFGHLPIIFSTAGPMVSGLSNKEKAQVRALYAEGKVGREALLEAENKAYHGPGTCTFYGTANSNQMLMEIMGLHLPGTAFVNPGTKLRDALTRAAAHRAVELARIGEGPLAQMVDERAIVNGIVGLLATGGSTNHTMHLVAIAAAAGIDISWDDFDALSKSVPLIARVYPNGSADINHFHAAGGMAFVIRTLLDAGLLHEDVLTVAGPGLRRHQQEPFLDGNDLVWREGPPSRAIFRSCARSPSPSIRRAGSGSSAAISAERWSKSPPSSRRIASSKRRRSSSTTRTLSSMPSSAASSSVISSPWCASRGRARTACPSCMASAQRSACCSTAATKWRS
jgi:phosphogluconate dehydratase